MPHPTVAFLGIGLMGHPMAARLAGAGLSPRVWNRTLAKAQALAGSGAIPCATVMNATDVERIIEAIELEVETFIPRRAQYLNRA